jgi:hypothetical protein
MRVLDHPTDGDEQREALAGREVTVAFALKTRVRGATLGCVV